MSGLRCEILFNKKICKLCVEKQAYHHNRKKIVHFHILVVMLQLQVTVNNLYFPEQCERDNCFFFLFNDLLSEPRLKKQFLILLNTYDGRADFEQADSERWS